MGEEEHVEEEPVKELPVKQKEVLEVGIGLGGPYLNRDKKNKIHRTGFDRFKHPGPLLKKYGDTGVEYVSGEINPDNPDKKKGGLPFKDGIFDGINIFFPNAEIFYGLCGQDRGYLWDELRRVTQENSTVELFVDIPPDYDTRVVQVNGGLVRIEHPIAHIVSGAIAHGFAVETKELQEPDKSKELEEIGTNTAKDCLRSGEKIFHIVAKKVSLVTSQSI